MTDAFTFDPDITFSPDHETLTGTAASFVSKIEIFDGSTDLGSAQIADGSWSFTHDVGTTSQRRSVLKLMPLAVRLRSMTTPLP